MKNNLTLFAREGKAKSLQNTRGGASRHEALIIAEQFSQCQTSRSEGAQQSTAQHDSARVFNYFNTQMARFLWNKKSEATVSKSSCSGAQGRATSAEQPTNHALITHLSPTQTVSLARIWKYVACLLIAFFVGVGNVWGADATISPSESASSAYYFAADGTAVTAIAGSGAASTGYNKGTPKITVQGVPAKKVATLTFTIASGVSITSFNVNGTANNNCTYALDGVTLTIGTALTGLNKTSSMSFTITCKDATSSSSNRNTTISSFTLTYTTSGGGGGDEPSCTTPTIAWSEGSTGDITTINELAATDLSIGVTEYTGDVTWAVTGDDIVALSNQDNDGCTVTGKADAFGTATLTASFTIAEGGDLCANTYSVTKTIKIIECNEPAAETNEIARFFVPCDLVNATGEGTPWTVTDEPSSSGMNTISTVKFGGSLSSSNWRRNPTSGLLYGKLTNTSDSYIKLKLNTGDFAAGDFVTAYVDENKNLLAMNSGEAKAFGEASASGITGEYKCSITLAADNIEDDGSIIIRRTNGIYVNRIIVTREPPCVGDPGNISKGTLSAGVLTLNAAGTPLSGDTWYWQSSSTGTDQTNSGTSYGVSAAGIYYVRSYNATGTCWSDAKSFTVTAADLVENFTVVYKDGETTLGSETVEVGEHPSAAGISTTKEFYTFAAWQESGVDKALNTVSAANGETVTLTARYTGNYAYGTYLFNSLTMGSTISKTITDEEVVYNDAFRVDNFYFAAGIKIQGEIGTAEETTTLTNYKGWKLKTNAKTIKFLVENNSQVKVAIGEKTGIQVTYTPLVGAETTVAQVKDNETAYSVKGGTIVTITTTSDNTTTLKRLSISNLYNVTYTDGKGDASGSASNVAEVTLPSPTETVMTVETIDYSFTGWKADQAVTVNDVAKSAGTLLNAGDVAVLGANTTFTAQWAVVTPKYAITKGTHANGDFTIDPAEQEAGKTVTLAATPAEDYMFSAWDVYKTGESSTKVSVTSNAFTMPAYAVTVDASFVADSRAKVLYVTSNSESDTKASDKVYAALKDTYNVKIVGPTSDADQTGYDLVVLHESVTGSNYSATAVAAAKTGTTPVLNTKAYFYNSGRWAWGTPNAGRKTKGMHVNRTYCNITNHPLFNDLTPDANDSIIILSSISGDNKPIQPIGSFTSGKEGYTLANVPDGCAIHELTPAQRGAVSGKYLLISLYTKDFANLNANGQKLFQNAAAYLIGNTAWEPVNALSSPAVTASPSAAYSVGDNIALTASATGVSAATTYTWYKGDTWAAAEEAGAIQAAATAASNGNTYGITGCASGDEGTYWCVISNGTGCDAKASLEITVSDVSYNIAFVSAYGTAPTATTGVSYTLPELSASGWEHQGWTASIDVTVDAATVTAGTTIDNGKIVTFAADVEFTAVWAEVFDVTFNMQSHGASIAAQHIVDGGKATEPNDPSAIGYDFGGWYTDAECTEGNEFDFNTAISDDTELFAKWTAFTGCTELWPATSGDALHVGDNVSVQSGSKGGTIAIVGMKTDGSSIAYNANGLSLSGGGADSLRVELNNLIAKDTKITLIMVAGGTSERGLNIQTLGKSTVYQAKWTPSANGELKTIEYTVPENSPLIGQSAFLLQRNNSVYLKAIKVSACGAALLNLSSAVSVADKGTVTLSATRVASGATATATYSAIDEAYEFDEWQISGTGATLSSTTANPVTITMGTADAVVTLKLKAATPKHTVTFNKMGKGDDIASQSVKEGDLVEEPTVTEPEGWILEGWYTENTFDTKWDFANDVMSTSDIELFANWVADTSIKLLSGSTVNHTDFITGVSAETVEISSVDYNCVKFSGTVSNVNGVKDLTRVIAYNAKTNKTKIQLHLYNTSTSNRTVLVKGVLEGNTSADDIVDLASITLGNKEQKETEYIEFNNAANRTIYIFIGSSAGDVRFLQVKVIDDGATPMKAAGQAGYSLNLNKGRFFGPASTDLAFEGLNVRLSGEYTAMNSGYAKLASTSMSFTVASAMTLNVTANNNKTYYVTKGSAGTDNETAKSGVSEFDLTAGTWYITAGSSEVQISNIAFALPKCAEPAFNALANSELCEGDAFVALNGTATVADAGTPVYQWYNADGDAAIDGATSATYTPTADGSYYVIATNQLSGYSDNTKKSATVTVTHYAAAAITTAPEDVRKDVGEEATLSVVATGKAPLTYQWYTCDDETGANPVSIAGANEASYSVTITAGLDQYYKVVVSSGCGSAEAVAKIVEWKELPQLKVSTTTTWDWANAGENMKLTKNTTPKKNEECVMANVKVDGKMPTNDETFNSQALLFYGENVKAKDGTNYYASCGHIKFTTTVTGKVTVEFSSNSDDNARYVKVNGVASETSNAKATYVAFSTIVPAGEVSIIGYEGETADSYIRIRKITFESTPDVSDADYTRDLTQGYYGTICLPNGGIMVGATLFELTYFDSSKKKIFCDEIVSGEMVAGTPYIFLPLEGASQLGVYYTDAADADAGNAHGLFGSYVQTEITPNDGNYILYNNQYCFVNSTAYVGANRAYIKLYGDGAATRVENPAAAPKPKQGRRRVAMSAYGEQVATGMDGVQGEGVPYQKVMIDGQLYIMRDGHIYNATGIMVK